MDKILIAHRGNTAGRFESYENEPKYIDKALGLGFDVEVDVWYQDNQLYLRHGEPLYGVNRDWFSDRIDGLWIHCKNIETLVYFMENPTSICNGFLKYHRFFLHKTDEAVITSRGDIWVFPGKQPIRNSIAVLPELFDDDLSLCKGICSDNIGKYKKEI